MKVLFFSNWLDNPYKTLLSNELESQGAKVEELMQRSNFFLKDVLDKKPDVFHMHLLRELISADTTAKRAVKLMLLLFQFSVLKLRGVTIAWTVHDWEDKLGLGKNEVERWKANIIGRFIDVIIVHCESTAVMISNEFGVDKQKKVHVIHHGNYFGSYPETLSKEQARKKLSLPEGALTFLLFGGVHRYKGVIEMIEAVEKVDADVVLVIAGKVGDSSLGEELTDISKRSEKIRFYPGLIDDDAVYDYFSASDCIAMPYRVYTTSGVALLAISFSRACLAPDIGFFRDILDHDGTFYYDPDIPSSLAETVEKVAENRESLDEMGSHNRQLAASYDWKEVGRQTWQAFDKAMQ